MAQRAFNRMTEQESGHPGRPFVQQGAEGAVGWSRTGSAADTRARTRARHWIRYGGRGLASAPAARTRTAPSMRVAALISGGKDSCYNMMQCIAAGHRIVALANLRPDESQVESDELDSYMYQTVGHHAIDLYAEAMALPLYRRTIRGRSLETGKMYTTREGDEVEDLYELLKLVKEKEEIEGVSVGAILSDYQRVRVENVCKRLDLQPLTYLWQRNQEDLLREMIASNIEAIIIKVAALGLDPDKHLGKTLNEMEPYLFELSKKYGVHVCGEGGEYETFTLDCPLFKKKIVVVSLLKFE